MSLTTPRSMVTIHHLGKSQSDRIVWLMEELDLPYDLKWYDRGDDLLMQADYRALHPAATAPVITDGDVVLTESTAIVPYIIHRHGSGRLSVSPGDPNYPHYLYWLSWNNNVQQTFFVKLAVAGLDGVKPDNNLALKTALRREHGLFAYLNQRLGEAKYLAGPAFTAADIMSAFSLTTLASFGGRGVADLPNVGPYLERITSRPACRRATRIAGPDARRPSS